jgi:DNA-directed RNA polymerase specialized sigma subunit
VPRLTKGQQAMAVAKALFVTNKNQTEAAKEIGVSQSRVAYAISVLKHLPDLADEAVGAIP